MLLEIRVYYMPKFWPWQHRGGELFMLRHNDKQEVVWRPLGDLPEKIGAKANKYCITCS
jgi:hypothetical protein